MKVLHVTPSFYPATYWGGPIWSTKAICDAIHGWPGVEVSVLTTDAAGPSRSARVRPTPIPYPVHYARRLAGHSIAPGLLARLPHAIARADLVHLTGTYSFPTLPTLALCRLQGVPLVWSPRGALQATAEWDEAPNRWAKHLFERGAQMLRSKTETVLHVTAPHEAAQSVNRLPDIQTVTIPNCVDIPAEIKRSGPRDGVFRLMYMGRLHPKKGVPLLLDAMLGLPEHVVLDIYGAGDPGYVAALRSRASVLQGRVRFRGHVDGAGKAAAFDQADLFVLPSASENFGIVVAEALAHGVPVVTTRGTPWAGLEPHLCGRCIDLAYDDLADVIRRMMRADLPAMGLRGRDWMMREFSPNAMSFAFADLYRGLVRGGQQEAMA